MAFNPFEMTIVRGKINSFTAANGLAQHTYRTEVDTFANVETAGYFPPYLGSNSENVRLGDLLSVRDSTGAYKPYELTSLDPLVVTPETTGGGSGDVTGPGSSTNNAIARFDGTTGKVIKNSTVTVSDAGAITTTGTITGGVLSSTGTISSTGSITANGGIKVNSIDKIAPGPGVVSFASPIQLPNAGGPPPDDFGYYADSVGASSTSSGLSPSVPVPVTFTRIGDIVHVSFQTFAGTNSANDVITIGPFLGAGYAPPGDRFGGYTTSNVAGTDVLSGVAVNSSGAVIIYYAAPGTPSLGLFPGLGGATTVWRFSFTYHI